MLYVPPPPPAPCPIEENNIWVDDDNYDNSLTSLCTISMWYGPAPSIRSDPVRMTITIITVTSMHALSSQVSSSNCRNSPAYLTNCLISESFQLSSQAVTCFK